MRGMETTQQISVFQSQSESPPQAYEAAIHTQPRDVTSDPKLTTAQKRAVLASWISDSRAVEDAPSSRRIDSGAVVHIGDIRQALVSLHELALPGRAAKLPQSAHTLGVVSRWLSRVSSPKRSNDNDDDPPPAPSGFGIPFRPTFVAAHGRAA